MSSTELTPSCSQDIAVPQLRTRALSIAMLAGTAALVVWLGLTITRIFTDAWVAPLHLSPDNDKVIQLRLQLSRQTSELARVEAEVARIDSELGGIDTALERLGGLRGSARDSMTWQADVRAEEDRRLERIIGNLRDQRRLLTRLRARQERFTAEARDNLEAGLIDKNEVAAQEQTLDSLALSLADNQRQLDEALMRQRQSRLASDAFRAELGASHFAPAAPPGRMPEVAAGTEHELRVELEMVKLQAERRGLEALRAAAVDRLAKERELLAEIEARPLFRAMHAATEVAFVPYDQLDVARPGARVVACVWTLFSCRDVGRVAEVLPGEVVAEDPWGELARGQFAILALDDPSAIQEKVLRIRGR